MKTVCTCFSFMVDKAKRCNSMWDKDTLRICSSCSFVSVDLLYCYSLVYSLTVYPKVYAK